VEPYAKVQTATIRSALGRLEDAKSNS